MNKKGFIRTLEVIFAIVITFIFLVYIVPDRYSSRTKEENFNYLEPLIKDDTFRNAALDRIEGCYYDDNTSFTTIVRDVVPLTFNYTLCVSDSPFYLGETLPFEKIYADSMVIAANGSVNNFKVIRLYTWVEQ